MDELITHHHRPADLTIQRALIDQRAHQRGADTTSDGDRIVWVRLDLPGNAMTDPGRPPDVSGLTSVELERTRRELAVSLALARPDSPARVPILAHMTAIDTELAGRAGWDARQP